MTSIPSGVAIEVDSVLPLIRISRDFAASSHQVFRAHIDPDLFTRWVGPIGTTTTVTRWDARTGGSWRYVAERRGREFAFRGCFHDVRAGRIVQTMTYELDPDGVHLDTLSFDDLGPRHARLRAESLFTSFEDRDSWLRSDMESGLVQGYEKLDALVARELVPGQAINDERGADS